MVADYVPFYFAPRSPMMYAIYRNNVPGYDGGTRRLIYLASTLERIQDHGHTVILTDRNAVFDYTEFIDLAGGEPPDGFIDWDLMRQRMWNSTDDFPDRHERRMAECLIHHSVPRNAFTEIAVRSNTVEREVRTILDAAGCTLPVAIQPDWYFE